ncbi:TatD family hydrolase [Pseudobacteriovorax antillogorgiicola]|uniref:TatD DNase family protein n=1 Tax=Pseudobacteriovorax antillogorgiicola TaxID=1513793 RepID=A0A1Y6BIG0_9BACT|nr:TatD family hydrolase [Pseudobacteriovorax antillogorgiicola]TCS55540.1 TatD DNase family protein [Pseudobacteriovorax antillogorgiicola]SMF11190.1 TatD DNase family protein [Pseudobacteriovorax antillogorgiicola]
MFADSLCHLTAPEIDQPSVIVDQSLKRQITMINLSGTHPEDWQAQRRLAQASPQMRFNLNFGIHPWWVSDDKALMNNYIDRLEQEIHLCHGIGEIGLDYARVKTESERTLQQELFAKQLAIACTASKPVIIHCVRAHHHSPQILRNHSKWGLRGAIHGFNGNHKILDEYLDLDLYISLGPHSIKSFSKGWLPHIPANRLLIESDAPQPRPEGLSTPDGIFEIAEKMTRYRQETADQLLTLSRKNLYDVYNLSE